MTELSIDLETFSSVDLKKCGLYRYVESPDFEIMLFGFAFDDDPVTVLDFMNFDEIPKDVMQALTMSGVHKKAFNAAFEMAGLGRHFGRDIDPSDWYCTMVRSLMMGLPASLGQVAKALRLDTQKDTAGTALINYFSKPCKPTGVNGGRTRNLPEHDWEKWEKYKHYNQVDVEVEREIGKRLAKYPIPAFEHKLWELDQKINRYGVRIDRELVRNAIKADDAVRERLTAEAQKITGLDNPNSVTQLKNWLNAESTLDVDKLTKETLPGLLDNAKEYEDDEALRLLEIRQELSKSSVKKYAAMDRSICSDGRVRGLLQYYGANRTGRWCLTGDHEILTPNGWERLDEWKGGNIACWSPHTEAVSFQTSRALEFDYEGDLYVIESQWCSQVSTPDHKMAYWDKNGGWGSDTVESLASRRFSIPFTGRRTIACGLDHDMLRVLIMTQADGHFTKEGDLRFHFSKIRKIERCKTLLRRCGLVFSFFNRDKSIVISVKSRHLPLWLRTFREKTFGMWLLDESPDVVFDELEHWDAYRCGPNSIQYVTTCEQNADVIQALAHLSGRAATVIRKHSDNVNWDTAFVVNIWLTPGGRNEIRNKPTKVTFSGRVYCAETKTGYFLVRRNGKVWVTGNSGRQVQVQNLPRNKIKDIELAREIVKEGRYEDIEWLYGSTTDILSQLVRTAFVPKPGHRFTVADFSAIEARVTAWLAGETWRLNVFNGHGKIYEASAAQMFHLDLDEITKDLRQRGKVAELALGFGGGPKALIRMGALDQGLTEDELPEIVQRWRAASPSIVQFWKTLEVAAKTAIKERAMMVVQHGISFNYESGMLFVQLPSGRRLAYVRPTLERDPNFGEQITYEGYDNGSWGRVKTYGGKLTENCLSGGSLVLTNRGWIPLASISESDLLWDGISWVAHAGVVEKGYKQTISVDGVRMTPDHKILTDTGWRCASSSEGYYRCEIKLPYRGQVYGVRRKEIPVADILRLRTGIRNAGDGFFEGEAKVMWVPEVHGSSGSQDFTRNVEAPRVPCVAVDEGPVYASKPQSVEQLWGERNPRMRSMAGVLREFLAGHGAGLQRRVNARTGRRKQRVCPGELRMGDPQTARMEQEGEPSYYNAVGHDDGGRSIGKVGYRANNTPISSRSRLSRRQIIHSTGLYEPVYDILNAGPLHRFTVLGNNGPMIVHNCVQAIARDCLAVAMQRVSDAGHNIVFHVHDEVVVETPETEDLLEPLIDLMRQPISWAPGLPLNAAGFVSDFYMKD